jgi:hypothetical protein
MKKEKVNEMLTEIRKHDASNSFAVFKYDGEQQNGLAEMMNDSINRRYGTLSDEEIYKILENEPDDLDVNLVIERLVLSLFDEVSNQPQIKSAFKNIVDVYDEETWQEINRLYRIVQYLKLFFVCDHLQFTDSNDAFAESVVNNFMNESASWDQKKLKALVESNWGKVDQMVFLCCYVIHQMKLNTILLGYALEDMLQPVLNHFYCDTDIQAVMLNLGESKYGFTKEQLEGKRSVEFSE